MFDVALVVDRINVDQANLDGRERFIVGLTHLFIGMKRDRPRNQTLVIIPTISALHIEGFSQRIGQFLPMR
ncbi:hypothetical protein D3C73_1509540 [compost metagenome]